MRKVGGLFIRGSGFSAEQIDGYNRDAKRLADYIDHMVMMVSVQ